MKRTAFLLLMSGLILVGCGKTPSGHDAHDGHAHAGKSGHVHKPLLGGQLVEVGDHQFNLEFKYERETGVLHAWVLDAHAENFVRIATPGFEVREAAGQKRVIALRAVGNEISGEKPGDTSSFEGEAPWLGEIEHFDGVVTALYVRGTLFRDIPFHFHPKQ